MKKILTFSIFIVALIFATQISNAADLRGRILLQVERNGEAWYVEPQTGQRHLMGRPADAFALMREMGLGISEVDYNSFAGVAPSNFSGRILLRVEANGEAYYVSPLDLKLYYMGRPADAFALMREHGLGISNDNIGEIPLSSDDSDRDGLTDMWEEEFNSDPYNHDSDGDGFPDGVEIENGFDPMGPGTLSCTTDWQCSDWSGCENDVKTRTCEDLSDCGITINKPAESLSCLIEECTPNWSCTDWNTCLNSSQARSCVDLNSCGDDSAKPAETQTCQGGACTPSWACSAWTECVEGQQVRSCSDINTCQDLSNQPETSQSCEVSYYTADMTVGVDSYVDYVEFQASWSGDHNLSDFGLTVSDRSGNSYNNELCGTTVGECTSFADPVIRRIVIQDNAMLISLNPDAGGWFDMEFSYPYYLTTEPYMSYMHVGDLGFTMEFSEASYEPDDTIVVAGYLQLNGQVVSWDDTTMLMDVTYTPHGDAVVGATMVDDGTGYDDVAGDGIFTGSYSNTGTEGSYSFKVRASGQNTEAGPYNRESSQSTVVFYD